MELSHNCARPAGVSAPSIAWTFETIFAFQSQSQSPEPEPRARAGDQLHKDPAADEAAIDFGVASIEMHFGV